MPCIALWWVVQAHKHANISLFLPCPVIFTVWIYHITCYVYMSPIISSVPFWLIFSKGHLLSAFSRFIPCLCLLRYVPVACRLIALNFATWCYFCHVQWFLQSLWNCYYLQSCHVLLSMFYWFLEIAQCSCFVMLYLWITSMPFVFMLRCCSLLFWCLQVA